MKQKDLKKVIDFHNNVTLQQIIDPIRIKEVYHIVKGKEAPAIPYMKMQRDITIFVNNMQQEVLDDLEELFEESDEQLQPQDDPRSKHFKIEDTKGVRITTEADGSQKAEFIPKDSAASPSKPDDQQSHSEDLHDGDTEDITHQGNSPKGDTQELKELQQQYEKASTPNEKRSLKQKINKLKKNEKQS